MSGICCNLHIKVYPLVVIITNCIFWCIVDICVCACVCVCVCVCVKKRERDRGREGKREIDKEGETDRQRDI